MIPTLHKSGWGSKGWLLNSPSVLAYPHGVYDRGALDHFRRARDDGGSFPRGPLVDEINRKGFATMSDAKAVYLSNGSALHNFIEGQGPFIQKAYDLSGEENDAEQTTASLQPQETRDDNKGNVFLSSDNLPNFATAVNNVTLDDFETARENSSAGEHRFQQDTPIGHISTNQNYRVRALVRRGVGSRNVRIRAILNQDPFPNIRVTVNLGDGTVIESSDGAGGTLVSTNVEADGDFWRITLIGRLTSALALHRVQIFMVDGTDVNYTGDGTSTLIIKNLQLQQATVDADYIPTTTARAWHNAGLKSGRRAWAMHSVWNLESLPANQLSLPFTFVAMFNPVAIVGTDSNKYRLITRSEVLSSRGALGIDDGRLAMTGDGSTFVTGGLPAPAINTWHVGIGEWRNDGMTGWLNGTQVIDSSETTTDSVDATRIRIGRATNTDRFFPGTIAAVLIYDGLLTAQQREDLTEWLLTQA